MGREREVLKKQPETVQMTATKKQLLEYDQYYSIKSRIGAVPTEDKYVLRGTIVKRT